MKAPKKGIKWDELGFGFSDVNCHLRMTWKDGKWSKPKFVKEPWINMHIGAACLHYGQECFEGIKAFRQKDGKVVIFRPDENAKRMYRTAEYCGLCHTLGRRYGLAGRMILNYDLTFLAMLLSEGPTNPCVRRCAVHPVKGRACACGGDAFDMAADMSVILTWWQIQDGIADHGFFGGLKYRAAALLLRRAYRKARARRPAFDESTRQHLDGKNQTQVYFIDWKFFRK